MAEPSGTDRPATIRFLVARLYPHFVQITAPRGRALPQEGHPLAGAVGAGGGGGGTCVWAGTGSDLAIETAGPGTVIAELQAGQLICIPA